MVNNNINPPACPRFSIDIVSANSARHDGIPSPTEKPRKNIAVEVRGIVLTFTIKGNESEAKNPAVIHIVKIVALLILSDKTVPIILDIIIPT